MKVRCNIARCPICGKIPDIILVDDDWSFGFYGQVNIQCKPFLRKPHIKLRNHSKSDDVNAAVNEAVAVWNYMATEQKYWHGDWTRG